MGHSTVLPDHVLRLMSKSDRAKLGKAGVTAAEASLKQEAKSERELQDQIEQYLRMRGVQWIIRSQMNKRTTVKRGNPDFCLVFNGIPFALEVKLPFQKLRVEQEQAAICMLKDGWRWHLVRDVDEVKRLLDSVTIREA